MSAIMRVQEKHHLAIDHRKTTPIPGAHVFQIFVCIKIIGAGSLSYIFHETSRTPFGPMPGIAKENNLVTNRKASRPEFYQ